MSEEPPLSEKTSSRKRRRMVVAFVEVETPQDRAFRHAATGISLDDMLTERRPMPKPYHDGGHTPEGRLRYWCAADRPSADGKTFAVAPVYRTNKVAEDAQCEDCGIYITELQALMTEGIGLVQPRKSRCAR